MKRTLAVLSVLLIMVLTLSLLTVPAFAAEDTVNVASVDMKSGDYLAVGAKEVSATKPSGGYAYYKNGVLELNNYNGEYTPSGSTESYFYNINASNDLKINLTGKNSGGRLYVEGKLEISGAGSLELHATSKDYGMRAANGILITGGDIQVTASSTGVYAADGDIVITGGKITVNSNSSGLYASSGSVTVNGGTLDIRADGGISNYGTKSGYDGIYAKENIAISCEKLDIFASYRGINAKGNVTITGGTMNIESGNYSISAGKNLAISGGTITADTWDSCLSAENITISGGELNLNGGSSGIYSETGNIVISEGTLNIATVYSGLHTDEGKVTISGGNVNIASEMEGISTKNWSNGVVVISNGKVKITSETGILSRGGLIIDGGEITIDSPLNGIDAFSQNTVINGGKLSITAKENGIKTYAANDGAFIINGGKIDVSAKYGIWAMLGIKINGGDIVLQGSERAVFMGASDAAVIVAPGMGAMAGNAPGESLRCLPADYTEKDTKNLVAGSIVTKYAVFGKAAPITIISEHVSVYEEKWLGVVGQKYTIPGCKIQDGVEPDAWVNFLGWSINGKDQGEEETITLTGETIIYAKWKGHEDVVPPVPENPGTPDEPTETVNPFEDVAEGKFYYEPVLWAYYGGITTGKDATHFNPSGECTRAQVVTFLWRAAGEPAPTSNNNPFPDVPAGKYYTNAVLWAVEKGITGGFKDGTFGPNKTCTRAQIVTFLWRYAGEPAPNSMDNPFPDVDTSAYYGKAVLWAVEEAITGGFKDGTFGPNKTCTRDQIVTFLYRHMVE